MKDCRCIYVSTVFKLMMFILAAMLDQAGVKTFEKGHPSRAQERGAVVARRLEPFSSRQELALQPSQKSWLMSIYRFKGERKISHRGGAGDFGTSCGPHAVTENNSGLSHLGPMLWSVHSRGGQKEPCTGARANGILDNSIVVQYRQVAFLKKVFPGAEMHTWGTSTT